ncbi:MAG TPA: SAV_915 family protein [Mycobacteriales bacterium]|nr:SAV_915 family protein [Mycobacteriales bacterium]
MTDVGEVTESPPTVFVPSRRMSAGDREVSLELRSLADGRTAMLAYSSLDRLVTGCGEAQPWVSIRADRLGELREHFDLVLVDVDLPEGLRPEPGDQPVQPPVRRPDRRSGDDRVDG